MQPLNSKSNSLNQVLPTLLEEEDHKSNDETNKIAFFHRKPLSTPFARLRRALVGRLEPISQLATLMAENHKAYIYILAVAPPRCGVYGDETC